MSDKRRTSFTLAVHSQDKPDTQKYEFDSFKKTGIFDKMVNKIAIEILPDKDERQYYTDRYTCLPPPIFLPCISAIEIGCYIYYVMQADGNISTNGPIPESNPFVYRPDKRIEIWRYVFYMLVHAGWVHLFFNMLVQLMLGVPLEMVHGSTRIAIIYFAGVIAGSLGTSVFDKDAYLLGASGGVYALLTAHLANILLNYQEMELRFLKLGALSIIASADIGFAIYERYSYNSLDGSPPVAYVAHLTGAIAGLTLGLVILKNFEQKLYKQVLWWIALTIYGTCSLFAILWNIYHNT